MILFSEYDIDLFASYTLKRISLWWSCVPKIWALNSHQKSTSHWRWGQHGLQNIGLLPQHYTVL